MDGKFGAVIVAAGGSTRMNTGRNKVLEDINGKPALLMSLEKLSKSKYVSEVVIVCRPEDEGEIRRVTEGISPAIVHGGEERQISVKNGVEALSEDIEYILIHDGARPLVSAELIDRVCEDALEYGAATAAVPNKDTCKLGENGFVESTPPRDRLYAVQTPQGFNRDMYMYALSRAENEGKRFTDDCQLIELAGGRVRLTIGDYKNIKLTTPDDLVTARALSGAKEDTDMRIGYGYDVHRLVENRALIIGGVRIPFEKGLLGHSDADVLTHAVSDALLGAAALGDIGHLFPDNDPKYEGADSLLLLKEVCRVVRANGYEIGNIDATLIAQRPKIAPYIDEMRDNLASACGIDFEKVSVKATTEEGLGFTGSGEGMAASAVALIKSR